MEEEMEWDLIQLKLIHACSVPERALPIYLPT